jgi:hypothetical protein
MGRDATAVVDLQAPLPGPVAHLFVLVVCGGPADAGWPAGGPGDLAGRLDVAPAAPAAPGHARRSGRSHNECRPRRMRRSPRPRCRRYHRRAGHLPFVPFPSPFPCAIRYSISQSIPFPLGNGITRPNISPADRMNRPVPFLPLIMLLGPAGPGANRQYARSVGIAPDRFPAVSAPGRIFGLMAPAEVSVHFCASARSCGVSVRTGKQVR